MKETRRRKKGGKKEKEKKRDEKRDVSLYARRRGRATPQSRSGATPQRPASNVQHFR